MPYGALRSILEIVDLPYPGDDRVSIRGTDPVLRTRYRVATAGAAAQAAIGVAIGNLWELKGGRPQNISVDVRAAGFNLRGSKHVYLDGKCITDVRERSPWASFFPVRGDRWIRFQAAYPHHEEAARRLLGWPADYEASAKITAGWDGVALETALNEAGGVAGFVRTEQEWEEHPQFKSVGNEPLVEIVRIGDAPPEPLPPGGRPLAGINVLDLTRVLAGPTCGRTLAEHGADVLKINASHLPNGGISELDTGIGKRSAFLDLRNGDDVDRLRVLAQGADVFSQGYRPGALGSKGFSPEEIARLRPGIIYVELSAWGMSGPWKNRRGYDTIVSAVNGMAIAQGDAKGPGNMPVSAGDYVTGYLMALGVITALRRRAFEGGSWHVRASLARTARFISELGLVDAAAAASAPTVPTPEEIEKLSIVNVSPAGRVQNFKPVLQLSETPPFASRPSVPLGHDKAEWLAPTSARERTLTS